MADHIETKKAKRSHERSIEKHLEKIESHQQDPSVPEDKKLRLIKHWNAEIRTWENEIKKLTEETLKSYSGGNNDERTNDF